MVTTIYLLLHLADPNCRCIDPQAFIFGLPAAIGLAIGCSIGNFIGGLGPIDYIGGAVANFTVATSETWKDKQSGEQKEKTEWHRIVMYQRLAEIAGEYLKKGSKVYLEGRLQTRKWQNQQGQDQYTTEIIVNDMQMLDSRNNQQQGQQQQGGYQQQQPMQQSYQQKPQNHAHLYNNQQQGQQQNNQRQSQQQPAPDFDDD